nr:MAG TPA: hypothetical protein [Caudoviricetes sp.]
MTAAMMIGALAMAQLVFAYLAWAWDENILQGVIWTAPLAMSCFILAFGDTEFWLIPAVAVMWATILFSELARVASRGRKP